MRKWLILLNKKCCRIIRSCNTIINDEYDSYLPYQTQGKNTGRDFPEISFAVAGRLSKGYQCLQTLGKRPVFFVGEDVVVIWLKETEHYLNFKGFKNRRKR